MQGMTDLIQKDTGDGSTLILPHNYSGITQGTWTYLISPGYMYNFIWYNTSNAVGDQIDYQIWLSKGIWKVSAELLEHVNGAIANVVIDGTPYASLDVYRAATLTHVWQGITNDIYLPTTGLKTLSLKVTGRHASSGGYMFAYYSIRLTRAN